MQNDVPTPSLVLSAGKGDIYDSSIWLGHAPTYTPLHRDPNPNLFVQLAGTKIVRLFKPSVGNDIFAKVQEKIGGEASAALRGEEMMKGLEKRVLEREVWGETDEGAAGGFEAQLESGDGLFIPKGWWHSIKGVGKGMTGSVSSAIVVLVLAVAMQANLSRRSTGGFDRLGDRLALQKIMWSLEMHSETRSLYHKPSESSWRQLRQSECEAVA